MRHLYALAREPGMDKVIEHAKTFERRRCGHKPEDFPEPLTTMECLVHCVGDKGKENRHRYVVATQDLDVRRRLREIPGVPLIYMSVLLYSYACNPLSANLVVARHPGLLTLDT